MTDEELKELVVSLVVSQKKTEKVIREVGKQIGGLGNKLGSFTEGLALPSMQQILHSHFHMEVVSPGVRVKKGGEEIEIDVLAYANSEINKVYLVEVKSHLREEGIEQMMKTISRFRFFFPEHKDKALYGILAAVEMSDELKKKVLSQGLYAAKISDEIFTLDVPAQFKARAL